MPDFSQDPSERIDPSRLQQLLPSVDVECHDSIASTNDRALELASQPDLTTPLLIFAEAQTKGRGRQANRWWSTEGALTFSLLTSGDHAGLTSPMWSRVGLVAGVALCQLIETHLPEQTVGLKWPNDVHLEGRKVAGILVETARGNLAADRLVIGMGVNVNNHLRGTPEEVRARATTLGEFRAQPFDRTALLAELVAGLLDNIGRLAANDPLLPETWQVRSVLTGRNITVQRGAVLTSGLCKGIDAEGALLLEGPAGLERVFSGHIV